MHRHRPSPWRFRGIELNTVGWTALLAPGVLVGAGIAAAWGAVLGLVAAGAVAGGLLAWLGGLQVEHRRYDRRPVPLPVVDGVAALEVLRSTGIHGDLTEVVDREGRSWSVIMVRRRDEDRARALVPWPPGRRSGRRYQQAQRAAAELSPSRPR